MTSQAWATIVAWRKMSGFVKIILRAWLWRTHGTSRESLCTSDDPYQSDMSEASASEFDELRCFVGNNANYYLRKWSSVLKNQGGTCGFNWAGFFLTVFWLAYRKMYLTTFLLFAIMTVESIGEELLFVWYLGYEETPNAVVLGIGLLIGATVGFFGNAWYLAHARKAILEVRSRGLDEAMTRQTLSNRGGTHLLNAFGLFLLYFMIMS